MRPELQARHFDYVMGGPILQAQNQWKPLQSVAANAQVSKLSLPLDPDAAFLLRSIAVRVQYDTTSTAHRQTGLNQLLFRFTNAEGSYLSQLPVPALLQTPWAGQLGNPLPLQRQLFYPANGVIYVDLINNGAATLTNLTFYFRGVKLFPWGVRRFYPYPKNMSQKPYTYIVGQSPTVGPTTIENIQVTQALGSFRRTFQVTDGDFVLRTIQAGPNPASNTSWEVFLRLFDSDGYPYSNDFVHFDTLAGNATGPASYPTGNASFQPALLTGPSLPGVFFPEIYLPDRQYLSYEIYRADSGFGTAAAQDFPMAFGGAKVYQA